MTKGGGGGRLLASAPPAGRRGPTPLTVTEEGFVFPHRMISFGTPPHSTFAPRLKIRAPPSEMECASRFLSYVTRHGVFVLLEIAGPRGASDPLTANAVPHEWRKKIREMLKVGDATVHDYSRDHYRIPDRYPLYIVYSPTTNSTMNIPKYGTEITLEKSMADESDDSATTVLCTS